MKSRFFFSMLLLLFLLLGCGRKSTPSVVYQERTITKYDTVVYYSVIGDSIPCDDFKRQITTDKDTVYIEVVKNKINIKTVVKRDTIIRTEIVTIPQKIIDKSDNRVIAKKGSIIGNDNTMTTKKTNWWWIFVAGMLTWFIIQNVVWKGIKRYINLPI